MEEDLIILEESQKIGKRWAKISKILNGRNENSVKNRYFTLLGLHSISRQKQENFCLDNEIFKKIREKITELKSKIADESSEGDFCSTISFVERYINQEYSEPQNICKSPYLYE